MGSGGNPVSGSGSLPRRFAFRKNDGAVGQGSTAGNKGDGDIYDVANNVGADREIQPAQQQGLARKTENRKCSSHTSGH
ncbi:hypothetical protein DID78_06675 [Candidatus Marinamargulisbacteria bacterium SCGC AG-343-D04]|nr:hypothetical protein DID78_06675 [Candidatus Marinamargulisbacteria bacterium SCGC AG-343-D04]